MILTLIATLVKRLGAVCIAFVILWHVAHHAGPSRGKAFVHVSRPDVHVVIDYRDFPVESLDESPVVCDLEPGTHVARIKQGKIMLDEQTFTIEPGKETVLYLRDHYPRPVADAHPVPRSADIRSADLAIGTRRRRPTHVSDRPTAVGGESPGPEEHRPAPDRRSAHRSTDPVDAVVIPSLEGL